MQIVKVKWRDASHIEEDMTEQQLLKEPLSEFVTVGFVVAEEENRLILAGTKSDDGVYRDSLILPRVYILEITELEEVTHGR